MKIQAYIGKFGVGKTFCTYAESKKLTINGYCNIIISYASACKSSIRDVFGVNKDGVLERKGHLEMSENLWRWLNETCETAEQAQSIMKKLEDDAGNNELKAVQMALDCREDIRNYRLLINWFGTTLGRDMISKDIWSKILCNKLSKLKQTGIVHYVLIDDLRFMNELDILSEFCTVSGIELEVVYINTNEEQRQIRTNLPDEQFAAHNKLASELEVDLLKNRATRIIEN